jgi:tRNA pseudouridine38-40 synthase
LPPFWDNLKKLQNILNDLLPPSIHVRKIQKVDDDFHARYGATKRTYRYIITTTKPTPFEARYVTYLPNINFNELEEKIKVFEGKHNFKNFCKTGSDVKTTIRNIFKTSAYKHKKYIILTFEADGFLRSQIRLMVGALHKLQKEHIQQMLQQEVYHKIKPAPPQGLYLAKIQYKRI